MVGVGDVADVLFTLEIFPVELPGVGEEELVAGTMDEEFGLGEAVPVAVGFDELHEVGVFGMVHFVHQPLLEVVADGRGPEAIGAVVVDEALFEVEHVDDEGHESDDALVDSGGGPGGPTAFGGPGDDELVDGCVLLLHEGGDGVHGADGGFGHGHAGGPGFVAGFEVVVPGVGDEIVFGAGLFGGVVVED